MSPLHAVAILAAGVVAGAINAVVGSGTLFTFPVLLAFGYAPVVANVSNTVGLVPGSAAGAIGYRRELRGPARAHAAAVDGLAERRRGRRACCCSRCPRRRSRPSCRCSSSSRSS